MMADASIHTGMTVREVVALVPAAADVMAEYGLHCFSCAVGGMETLGEACRMHGFDDDTVAALLTDIHDAMERAPKRPQTLTITAAAAEAVRAIAESQGRKREILVVTVDEHGGFCLEFQNEPLPGDLRFSHTDVPELSIFASVLTLSRIGGATIDCRDGRLKLDLPEDALCCDGREGAACHCEHP